MSKQILASECTKLADKALEKLVNPGDKFDYNIPIYSIDDIPLNVVLEFIRRCCTDKIICDMYLEISTIDELDWYHDDYHPVLLQHTHLFDVEMNREAFAENTANLLNKIPTAFNKLNSTFHDDEDLLLPFDVANKLASDTVLMKWKECCVCTEYTNWKTRCKHPVCIPCLTKLKPLQEEDEDDDRQWVVCPMCRDNIFIK